MFSPGIAEPASGRLGALIRGLGAVALAAALASCAEHYVRGEAAVAREAVLRALLLDQADVRYQSSCVLTQKRPRGSRFFDCMYVQTATHLHVLSFNRHRKEFEPMFALPIADVARVAFRSNWPNSQMQISYSDQTLALSLLTNLHATEDVFKTLVAAGVPQGEPGPWIDLQPPRVNPTLTNKIYVER